MNTFYRLGSTLCYLLLVLSATHSFAAAPFQDVSYKPKAGDRIVLTYARGDDIRVVLEATVIALPPRDENENRAGIDKELGLTGTIRYNAEQKTNLTVDPRYGLSTISLRKDGYVEIDAQNHVTSDYKAKFHFDVGGISSKLPAIFSAHTTDSLHIEVKLYLVSFVVNGQTLAQQSSAPEKFGILPIQIVSTGSYRLRAEQRSEAGDYDGAIADYTKAIEGDPKDYASYEGRGWALAGKNELDKALIELTNNIVRAPNRVSGYHFRGRTLRLRGNFKEALSDFQKVDEITPNNAINFYLKGDARIASNDLDAGIADLNRSNELDPEDGNAVNSLGWLFATHWQPNVRDGKKAVEYARQACERTEWEDPDVLDTLAAAYAESGDFDAAVKWQSKALEFPAFLRTSEVVGRQRLELYRQHKPFREPAPTPTPGPLPAMVAASIARPLAAPRSLPKRFQVGDKIRATFISSDRNYPGLTIVFDLTVKETLREIMTDQWLYVMDGTERVTNGRKLKASRNLVKLDKAAIGEVGKDGLLFALEKNSASKGEDLSALDGHAIAKSGSEPLIFTHMHDPRSYEGTKKAPITRVPVTLKSLTVNGAAHSARPLAPAGKKAQR